MKVLFDHPTPFFLAHGGYQLQIEQTKKNLQFVGVEVEWLRWWDTQQEGDIIHYFGRPTTSYVGFAHRKGKKVVMSELLTGMGSRSASVRFLQKLLMDAAAIGLPEAFTAKLSWDSYKIVDACIALTAWEASLMRNMFSAPPERIFVVPNGVEPEFFQSQPVPREQWLLCTATITERKRVLELAEGALHANVPIWFIGSPYSENDSYFKRFMALAKSSPGLIRYEGPVQDRSQLAAIYRKARGFVLLSMMESLSLSALEAAACETPLLLSDLPWARSSFDSQASYCPPLASSAFIAQKLREFYSAAPNLSPNFKPKTWHEVAQQLNGIYCALSTSR